MHADLALADQAVLAHMHELDRILDGENVAFFARVDVVDHGRERGGFARAGFAGDQDQAAVDLAQIASRPRGSLSSAAVLCLRGNRAKHRAHAVQLAHHVDAKTRDARDA